jgi:hypothetical protein
LSLLLRLSALTCHKVAPCSVFHAEEANKN